jgi:2,4-dienoyl-CoA reductase-like NADH-dependent reductase (Old Yellow Enzyme family)
MDICLVFLFIFQIWNACANTHEAQFLSGKSNQRTDKYGGSPANRARIVVDIINGMRKVVPKTFAIGIKLNSVDHQHSGDLSESLEQISLIRETGIDFLEISGGSYEDTKVRYQSSQQTLNSCC